MMRIEVMYYAWIREKVSEKETLEVEEGISVREAFEKLRTKHPDLDGENVIIAINGNVVDWNTSLKDGDVMAVFPPAGGG